MQKFSSTCCTTASPSSTFDPLESGHPQPPSPLPVPVQGWPFFSPFGATKMVLLAASAMSFSQ